MVEWLAWVGEPTAYQVLYVHLVLDSWIAVYPMDPALPIFTLLRLW